jgi:rod shape-determining protein MreD
VRALVSVVVVAVAVVAQLTVVDRIAFPGGAGPDLVLLVVAALALAGGPMAGVLTGFCAGLALDVAPPGSHFTGQNALVFCLVGYACGLLADDSDDAEQGHTALFEIVVMAGGAVLGEALGALLGVMLSDPRVTWPAITHVLPVAVAYDLLLCPFVLYAVAAALRLGGVRREGRRPAGWSASQARSPAPGPNQTAIRQLAGANVPRLRLSERDRNPGSIGLRSPAAGRPPARREPQLKLGRAGARTSAAQGGLGAAFAPGGLGAGAPKVRFGGRRREGVLGGSLLGGAAVGSAAFRGPAFRGSGLGGSGLGGSRFGSSSMGRSLLGGSVFSRPPSSFGRSPARSGQPALLGQPGLFGRAAPLGRAGLFGRPAVLGLPTARRRRGNPLRSRGSGRARPRFSRGRSLARLTGALRPSARPKSPGRGWLRSASPRGRRSLGRGSLGGGLPGGGSPGRGLLGGGSPGRAAFGRRRLSRGLGVRASASPPRLTTGHKARLRMPRPKAKRRWRTGGYR